MLLCLQRQTLDWKVFFPSRKRLGARVFDFFVTHSVGNIGSVKSLSRARSTTFLYVTYIFHVRFTYLEVLFEVGSEENGTFCAFNVSRILKYFCRYLDI